MDTASCFPIIFTNEEAISPAAVFTRLSIRAFSAFSDVEKPFLFSDLAATAKSENTKGVSASEKAQFTQLPG